MSDQTDEQPLGLQTPFHEAAAAAARKAMGEIARNWEGALSGQDVEAIHDLRVGTRRLRAALSVYEHAFAPREFRRVERAMSQLTDALGPARDTDVLIEHVESVVAALGDKDEAEKLGLRTYIDHLKQQRSRHQEALDRAMCKIDVDQVTADLESAVIEQPD
jgi:CHAD domain-containing protein